MDVRHMTDDELCEALQYACPSFAARINAELDRRDRFGHGDILPDGSVRRLPDTAL